MRETEAKIALIEGELDVVRLKLVAAGAEAGAVDDEENLLFDRRNGGIRNRGQTLRVRMFEGRPDARFTFKGAVDRTSRYKSRDELEVQVSDGATLVRILAALGLNPTARYKKHREYWRLDGAEITLDRVESGDFMEIEADEGTIDAVLTRLGLAGRPHLSQGYASLVPGARSMPSR
jgi:predicted adenylyl cyclase CyaB